VSYDKTLHVLINTVVRWFKNCKSKSSYTWSIKIRWTKVLGSREFLNSVLLPSEELETVTRRGE
jgi:hypothetical protein